MRCVSCRVAKTDLLSIRIYSNGILRWRSPFVKSASKAISANCDDFRFWSYFIISRRSDTVDCVSGCFWIILQSSLESLTRTSDQNLSQKIRNGFPKFVRRFETQSFESKPTGKVRIPDSCQFGKRTPASPKQEQELPQMQKGFSSWRKWNPNRKGKLHTSREKGHWL